MRRLFLFILLTVLISNSSYTQECTPEKPVIWLDNTCISCDEAKINFEKLSDAHSNNPDDFLKLMDTIGSIQKNCPDATAKSDETENQTQAVNGECPDEKPLIDDNGYCHACDDPLPFSMPFDKLDLCEQTCLNQTNRYQSGPYCLPKKCPNETPLLDSEGNCHSCTSAEESITTVDGCGNCSNRFLSGAWVNNGLSGTSCSLKEKKHFYEPEKQASFDELLAKNCPDNKPILDENGNCIPCIYHHDVYALKGCEKCPNRAIGSISATPYTFLYTCEIKE